MKQKQSKKRTAQAALSLARAIISFVGEDDEPIQGSDAVDFLCSVALPLAEKIVKEA